MATDQQRDTPKPWYLRGKTLLLGAGALAAAGLGILNFWDRLFPPDMADVAIIESIVITKQTSLADFATEGKGKGSDVFPLEPAPDAAARAVRGVSAGAVQGVVATPTPLPRAPTTSTPTSTPTPTFTPTPTPTTSSTPATPTPEVTPTPEKTSGPTRWRPTKDYLNSLAEEGSLAPYAPPVTLPGTVSVLGIEPTGKDGEELPPEQLAERLKVALQEIEAQQTGAGLDPLGWTVAIRLTLEGLDDVPLILTWSLDGANVPTTWAADNVAYRVVATTPREVGSAEIWVPDLAAPGVYNVNVKLEYESDGTIAAIGEPLQISND